MEHTKLVNALYVSLFKSTHDAHLRELWLDLGAIADNLTGFQQPKINLSQSHDVLVAILDALEISGRKSRGLKKDIKLEDRKSTRLNSSHSGESRMPSSA